MSAPVQIASIVGRAVRGQETNATITSYTVQVPTKTRPAASATRTVIDFDVDFTKVSNTLRVWPYGGNDNNDLVHVKVVGCNRVRPQSDMRVDMYFPSFICEVQGTLSSALLGLAGEAVVATNFFCDIISITNGTALAFQNTADVDLAWFQCDASGFELVELIPRRGTGGDSANCLWAWVG
jgi:hypothetical protein